MSDDPNSTIRVRRATRDDLSAIVAMLADDELGRLREDTGEPLDGRYVEAFQAIDSDARQLLIVIEDGAELVGCAQLSFLPGLSNRGMLRGQIEGVRIVSERRGQGLGRVLLSGAIRECRRRGCGVAQLTSDKSRTDAVRFYRSLGFRDSHEGMKLAL